MPLLGGPAVAGRRGYRMLARKIVRGPGAAFLLMSGVAMASTAKAPVLMVVEAIEHGQWEIHEVGATSAPRTLCLSDPETLIQLRHPGIACSHFVIDNQPKTLTVSYSCSGAGSGRTTISLATPRIIRLQTQGLAQNAPFDSDYSARRIGACQGVAH